MKPLYLQVQQTDQIVLQALDTLGLKTQFVADLLGVPCDQIGDRITARRLGLSTWWTICHALHLSMDSIHYGYVRTEHRARIAEAKRLGTLRLPKTPELKKLLREIRQMRREEIRWRSQQYAFRLRWKIRFSEWKFAAQIKLKLPTQTVAMSDLVGYFELPKPGLRFIVPAIHAIEKGDEVHTRD